MRWVFIRPRNYSPYYDPEIQEPLGLEYLGAMRRSKGDAVLIMDAVLESMSESRIARRALSFRPGAIGFSITTARELSSVMEIYNECRKRLGEEKVCWLAGGNFVSHEPDQALRLLPDDFYLVRFEGENALDRVARHPMDRTLEAYGSTSQPIRLLSAAPVADLDALPFPLRPFASEIKSTGNALNIQGSRGCLGNCRYCSSPDSRILQKSRWRGRSMTHIVEEIAQLHQAFGVRSFNFIDEDFLGSNTLSTQRARQFAAELEKRGLRISFSIQVRPDSLNCDIVDLLSAHGLSYVFIGIESDDAEDFKRWGRPWSVPPWQVVTRIHNHQVEVGAGVLLFHSHSTFHGIQRFGRQLHHYGLLNYRSAINRLDAMPGSVFHREGIEAGMLKPMAGPQPLPFVEKRIEVFFHALTAALSPLGPPSMHAVCSLPRMVARARLYQDHENAYQRLKKIIHDLDEAVARTMFALLEDHIQGRTDASGIQVFQKENLSISLAAAKAMADEGLAPSVEQLREAIRMDAGI